MLRPADKASMRTIRLTTENLLALDTQGRPVLELELRANGVTVIAADGTRLAFVPVFTSDPVPDGPTCPP